MALAAAPPAVAPQPAATATSGQQLPRGAGSGSRLSAATSLSLAAPATPACFPTFARKVPRPSIAAGTGAAAGEAGDAAAAATACAGKGEAPVASEKRETLANSWTPPPWCAAPGSATSRRVLRLRDADGVEPGRAFDLSNKGVFYVGRDIACDIKATDKAESVSRRHAAILRDGKGSVFVVDLWATNGTFLGGHKISPGQPVPWNEGEALCLGGSEAAPDCEEAVLVVVVGERRRSFGTEERLRAASRGSAKRARDDAVGAPRTAANAFRGATGGSSRRSSVGRRSLGGAGGVRDKASTDQGSNGLGGGSSASSPGGAGREAPEEGGPGTRSPPAAAVGGGGGGAASASAATSSGAASSGEASSGAASSGAASSGAAAAAVEPSGPLLPAKRRRLTLDWSRAAALAAASSSGAASSGAGAAGAGAAAAAAGEGERSPGPGSGAAAAGSAPTSPGSGSSSPPKATDIAGPQGGGGGGSGGSRGGRGGAAAVVAAAADCPAASPLGEADAATAGAGSGKGGGSGGKAAEKCDKCDGPHATDACPHFRKPREVHKDAWANYGLKSPQTMGSAGGNFVLRNAQTVKQAGDGSCLYHSLCFGLKHAGCDEKGKGGKGGKSSQGKAASGGGPGGARGKEAAMALRRELARFVKNNPHLKIAGDTLEEWVRWDANTSCSNYARRMAVGGWGGGIELAACSRLKKVNVHVYEQRKNSQFKRISCFNCPKVKKTIHVLYRGRMHYDALLA